ncbi:carbonic anhydrase [Amnibacterium setariae]|uniref:carbonic anhydrase n=1 Tax=Amnibacterium setariae TaxID=2306585 RepID=A0A3A1U231_9MICO|nr:carbonic anhydrase [Amnibacterium setariae]RIX30904.1 carbonic anhydrase [Amnibacterium setariae]
MSTERAATAAWQRLADGNERFVADRPEHPRQDAHRRAELAEGQRPVATILGCSDSRVAAEVLFDQGLGDLFVIRNAGQVASASAIASVEYAVGVLGVPLVVVLAHDRCGAVQAAIDASAPDAPPLPPLIAAHIQAIRPAVRAAHDGDAAAVGEAHLESTVASLLAASDLLSATVADGTVDVVGANYRLAEGRVERRFAVGATS